MACLDGFVFALVVLGLLGVFDALGRRYGYLTDAVRRVDKAVAALLAVSAVLLLRC